MLLVPVLTLAVSLIAVDEAEEVEEELMDMVDMDFTELATLSSRRIEPRLELDPDSEMVTILIPALSQVAAGINSAVDPFLSRIEAR